MKGVTIRKKIRNENLPDKIWITDAIDWNGDGPVTLQAEEDHQQDGEKICQKWRQTIYTMYNTVRYGWWWINIHHPNHVLLTLIEN